MPLAFKGLHTSVFLCSATTVGCLGFQEPGACVGGLPMNLLLHLIAVGVLSKAVLSSGMGENSFEYLAFRGSLINDCLPIAFPFWCRDREVWSGVVMCELVSGRRVAMDTRLFGWIACVVEGVGLTAIDILLGIISILAFVGAVIVVLWVFSFPSDAAIVVLIVFFFWGGRGDCGGTKLLILRNGILIFEGANGGFFSVLVFTATCLRVDRVDVAAKALVSCFILVFLSSANWFSRSLTCYKDSVWLAKWTKTINNTKSLRCLHGRTDFLHFHTLKRKL